MTLGIYLIICSHSDSGFRIISTAEQTMISSIQIWIQPGIGIGRCGDMMSTCTVTGYIMNSLFLKDSGFRCSFHVGVFLSVSKLQGPSSVLPR